MAAGHTAVPQHSPQWDLVSVGVTAACHPSPPPPPKATWLLPVLDAESAAQKASLYVVFWRPGLLGAKGAAEPRDGLEGLCRWRLVKDAGFSKANARAGGWGDRCTWR